MRSRAEQMNSAANNALICTFHSFGARFLRVHGAAVGLPRDFTIYDDSDSLSLLRSLFPNDPQERLKHVARRIQHAKHGGRLPDDIADEEGAAYRIEPYYRSYQERLREIGNVDFGDLILKPLHILKTNPAIRKRVRETIQVLLVDEYQDTNTAQYALIQQLHYPDMYLCVVGDDDQSIYAFRGSDVSHIVNFPHYFSHTKVMYLLQNYRSTQPILSLASDVIARNNTRYDKVLYTHQTNGEKPLVVHLYDDYQEAAYIIGDIQAHSSDDVAIVYRTNIQSRAFESELNRIGMLYRVVGGVRFYEREEVKDLIAYLKLIVNVRDEVALRRIINKPLRGIGAATIRRIMTIAAEHEGDVLQALEQWSHSGHGAAAAGCGAVAAAVRDGRALIAQSEDNADSKSGMRSLADVLQCVLELSGLGEYYAAVDKERTTFKSENIFELVGYAAHYPATQSGLSEFLERAELEDQASGADNAAVTLITIHNTKGLEFDTVYIAGLQDGLFPHTADLDVQKIEEERRLFYVAITRAKKRLVLTTFELRHRYGASIRLPASRFLSEIDADLIDQQLPHTYREYRHDRPPTPRPRRDGPIGDASPPADDRDPPRFAVGMAVFHDDYGSGEVLSRKRSGSQYILAIRFENGKMAHFIEKYAALDRVAAD